MPADDRSVKALNEALAEVSERVQVLVREEIELAKAEVTQKVSRLVRGLVVGLAAGLFVSVGLLFLLHTLSWFAWDQVGGNYHDQWKGFLIVTLLLFVLGVVAGVVALRFVKGSSSPKPEMAIDEARLIRQTVRDARPAPDARPAADAGGTAPSPAGLGAAPLAVTDPPPGPR